MQEVARESVETAPAIANHLHETRDRLKSSESDWESLAAKIDASRTSWLIAVPKEAPSAVHSLPTAPPAYVALASDGSQIAPSKHEASPCFLINASKVALHYGERPR